MNLRRRDFLVKIPAVSALASVSSNGAFIDFVRSLYENSSRGWATVQHPLAKPKLWSLANNQTFKGTPVIMLSSKDSIFDRARGRIVGSEKYLTKPFSKEDLINAITTHVG